MSQAQSNGPLHANPLYALLDPAALRDPYPVLARIREASPVVVDDGMLIVGDYKTCLDLLRSPVMGSETLASDRLKAALPADYREQINVIDSIFFLDPPDHTRQRRLISKAFTPRITAKYEPWIQSIVDGLFSGFAEKGSFDAVRDLATRLSMGTICELMDIPSGDMAMLRKWSDDLALATEVPLLAALGSSEMFSTDELAGFGRTAVSIHAYFADLIHKRRKKPGDDLITSLLQTEDQGQTLARHEVTNVLLNLFIAAHVSVTNLISNGILALWRNPDQLELLRNDPSIAPLLVEEVLRYDAPVQLAARLALAPTQVGGVDVEPGTFVVLLLAAANRDEAEYPQADRFLGSRRTKGIGLAFGAGPHYCIGASLAKLEAEIALKAVAGLTDFAVDEESLAYRRHVVVRGMQSMTVNFRP
uniref:Putative P450 oxygenase n=1 Tax=Streptomyces antibioticus TaxID=1890 RepID=G9VYV8_STRAT|nr:putative P450 oxygenase [Streptomyces antibioticus]